MNPFPLAEQRPDIRPDTGSPAASSHRQESDKLLHPVMERLKSGDSSALGELYEMTAPTLFSLAREVLHDSADADEVIGEVYIHVSQTAAQYDPSRNSVITWLLMICRSRVLERYRENPPGPMQRHGRAAKPTRRRLLNLAFFQGLGHHEIAAETELALGTVKTHLRRALSARRAEMESKRTVTEDVDNLSAATPTL